MTLRPDRLLEVSDKASADHGELVARLRRIEDTYEVEAMDGHSIWINGQPHKCRLLEHLDTVEFSDDGPISRVYLYRNEEPLRVGVADILGDAAAYIRSSRRPIRKRIAEAVKQITRRFARETTLLFRVGVTTALILLGVFAYQQNRINTLLRQQIATGTAQLESFSRVLAQVRKETLTPTDLSVLRQELTGRMTTAAERLSQLEKRSKAIARVISNSRSSILFLQGAYGFRENATGRMLRHVVGPDGKLLVLPNGFPLLSLEGKGPVAQREFSGTGFAVGDKGIIVTSRHIGQPWLFDIDVAAMAGRDLKPVQTRFIAYFEGIAEPKDVALVRTSKTADVAILRLEGSSRRIGGLKLAPKLPELGQEVILMGYPTGIRSMVAQAGPGFVNKLQQDNVTDNWKVAARLAAAGRIVPLASRGIVGGISKETIVYDAETTHGGSGGPVLDINGAVVAINSAILPEYGGSNLGVPVSELRQLIADVETTN